MKESLLHIDKNCIFRETFQSEDSVRKNGGTPTSVTFSNGTAVFNGGSTTKITFPNISSGTYSIRIRLNNTTLATKCLFDARAAGTGTGAYIHTTVTTGLIQVPNGTVYINGVADTTLEAGVQELVITGMTHALNTSANVMVIGNRSDNNYGIATTYELFEIYKGTLTANEVLNLYQQRQNKELNSSTSEILRVDARNGVIQNKYSTITNTDTSIVKNGNVYVMDFNGTTSKVDCGSYDDLTGDKTFIAWIKPRTMGEDLYGRIFSNNMLLVRLHTFATPRLQLISDGSTNGLSAISSIRLGYWQMIVVTRTSAGITNFYINSSLSGTANQSSGTPTAGTSNLIIGNSSSASTTFDGQISNVRIYDGILSTQEITNLYSAEKRNYGL